MYIQSLYVRNFRNYEETELHFSPGLNLFHGENAQGKTNLLEAISLIATGKSFRTPHLQEMIREGASFFFLEARVMKQDFEHTVAIAFDGTTKKLTLDGNSYSTFQHLLGLIPSVFFTPSDVALADGSPAVRRKFLDLHLAQRDPLYIHHLSRYFRAMKQRNALLRYGEEAAIACWEHEMVSSASYLWLQRETLLSDIQEPLRAHGKALSAERECYEIRPFSLSQESYALQLEKNRPRERQLKLTLTGPHRDDFRLLVNGRAAETFGSEGQKKTVAFSLRLSEWDLFTKNIEGKSLLCIDDLGVHLDALRKTLLGQRLGLLGQVFVTAPEEIDSLPHAKKFLIREGSVVAYV